MAVEVVMPRMGLNMEEGTVVAWHKQEGDTVRKGDVLLEIETDKVTTEIEAQADGIVGKILVDEGTTVPIGTPIAYIISEGESVPETTTSQTRSKDVPLQATIQMPGTSSAPSSARGSSNGKLRASPAARRAARELGIDLREVTGRGPNGRILETDVKRFYAQRETAQSAARPLQATPVATKLAQELGVDLQTVKGSGPRGIIRKEDVLAATGQTGAPQQTVISGQSIEPSRAHRIMAERMSQSFSTAPHFYLTTEIDASQLVQMRQTLLPKIESATNLRLTYTDILIYFLARALVEFPRVNASWQDGKIILAHHANIGIAVDTDTGLIVPVIHQAETLTLSQVCQQRASLVNRARSNQLTLDDLSNGSFTLSNLGTFRVDMFNAILNPPQAAILAVGRIKDKVIAINGEPAIRPVLGMSLTCDHRVLDGAQGARFLTRMAEMLEEPFTAFM